MLRAFKYFDKDGDGSITRAELKEALAVRPAGQPRVRARRAAATARRVPLRSPPALWMPRLTSSWTRWTRMGTAWWTSPSL